MDTFWLKIVLFALLVVGVIVFIGFLTSGTDEPEKTFYDQVEEDRQEFLAQPQPLKEQEKTQVPVESQVVESKEAAEPVVPVQKQVVQPKPTVLYFKPLSEIEQVEAEKLLNVAVPGRSIGRLPMTGFNLMVPNCRQIIQRWPDSQYAYQARRLLADLPVRYQTRYNVTKEEIDLSMYYTQRPGTQPFTMEESR
ncbi:MAG: hypothetical protein ACYSTT_00345 [Planctomycetota bacterium]|jgi:hypothetical protein